MKKFTITSDICRMPIVDMATGRVIARSFTPYYDRNTLSVSYLALIFDDSGIEKMFVPFSSICFVNDVCTMINIPAEAYMPDIENSCRLIGEPLNAKAGALPLFSFGTIVQTDIADDGSVQSLTLSDGHSFLVPREDTPENTAVNDAFASEAFQCINDTQRVTSVTAERKPSAAESTGRQLRNPMENPAPKQNAEPYRTETGSFAAGTERYTSPAEASGVRTAAPVSQISAQPKNNDRDSSLGSYGTRSAVTEENPVQEFKEPSSPTPPPMPAAQKKQNTKRQEFRKLKNQMKRFVAPLVAMWVFFILYVMMSFLFIRV